MILLLNPNDIKILPLYFIFFLYYSLFVSIVSQEFFGFLCKNEKLHFKINI